MLFSHGGLTADFLRWLNKDLLDADIEEVIAAVNDAHMIISGMINHPYGLGPQYETREMFRADTYKQVVGIHQWRRYLKRHHIDRCVLDL